MFPAELLPDFLFDQRELLLTYAYCLHFVGRNHTRVPFEGKIISLRPREVLIPISKWDLRLGIAPETFLHHLSELEQLDLVELTKEERYLLVQFTKINIPPVVDPRSRDVAEGAVQPITVNDFSDRYLEHVGEEPCQEIARELAARNETLLLVVRPFHARPTPSVASRAIQRRA